MKELSIEQKAKRYDEALEIARQYWNDRIMPIGTNFKLERMFPELKESDDERIRKELIRIVDIWTNSAPIVNGIPREKLLAWLEKQGEHVNFRNKIQIGDKVTRNRDGVLVNLSQLNRVAKKDEKQGEQKPDDKVEPKFHEGNWYQCIKDFFGKGVTFDKNTAYYCEKEGCLQDEYGCHIAIVKDLYDNFKLWTIQDAKDGDVLFIGIDASTCIFKKLEGNLLYSYIISDGKLLVEDSHYYYEISDNVYPATKEQRDTLFAKMKEAGYEWDAEKKELKKIEQKPTWSEGDATHYNRILKELNLQKEMPINTSVIEEVKSDIIWFKSLRPQSQWKPSDEQIKALRRMKAAIAGEGEIYEPLNSLYEDLKKLMEE